MKNALINIVFVALLLSCATTTQENKNLTTQEKINSIQLLMTRSQIISILGDPFQSNTLGSFEFLLYKTRENSFYLLGFDNGVLLDIKKANPNDPEIKKLFSIHDPYKYDESGS